MAEMLKLSLPECESAPEKAPPGNWRAVVVPVVIALVGLFIATVCANVGQAEKRREVGGHGDDAMTRRCSRSHADPRCARDGMAPGEIGVRRVDRAPAL